MRRAIQKTNGDGEVLFLRLPRRKFGDPKLRAHRSDGTPFTKPPISVRVARFRRHK